MQGGNKSGGESSDSALSSKNENPFESESSPLSCKKASSSFSSEQNNTNNQQLQQQQNMITNDAIRTGSSSQNQSVAKEKVNNINCYLKVFNHSVFSFHIPKTKGKVYSFFFYYCFEYLYYLLFNKNSTDPNRFSENQ
jgi:hypothetical protein